VYAWKARHAAAGIDGLREVSRRPRTSPSRLAAEAEALGCPPDRVRDKQRGAAGGTVAGDGAPVLVRNGLVTPQAQQHKRKYRRWARETPMALRQLDLVGGIYLDDGRECKVLSDIDNHSRFVVAAAVMAVPSGRAVADAFTAAMRQYGVPAEVLTDNGKHFTGRFTRPRPAEVLFERVCREHGITAKLTRPCSPTTTGKIERWHQTLRRELLDVAGPFADLPSAQAAITAWVQAYNHQRPHQALGMATPASLFRPGSQPGPLLAASAPEPAPEDAGSAPVLLGAQSAGAVEFDTVISPGGVLGVIPAVQRIKMGAGRPGSSRTYGPMSSPCTCSSAGSWSRPCRPAWTPRTWPR
jgi:transposase InsO family protein